MNEPALTMSDIGVDDVLVLLSETPLLRTPQPRMREIDFAM
jgi:hypothetical protein